MSSNHYQSPSSTHIHGQTNKVTTASNNIKGQSDSSYTDRKSDIRSKVLPRMLIQVELANASSDLQSITLPVIVTTMVDTQN